MARYNLGTARGRVDIDTKGLKDADLSLREAGRGLLLTGGALVAGFGYVVKTAADFEKQLDFVQAITEATGSEMDTLSAKAIELGKKGPFGPNEIAGSFVELAKAGVETQDIIDGVAEASVNLAAAGDLGLVESTEILVNTLKTFNLSAEDAVGVVDQIAGAANASTIDVDDFAFSMRYAGSIAAAIGIPLNDVATALAILGDRGIKGSTGGTSLRRVLLNLQPASEKAADTLKELGIITEDGTNKFFTAEGQAKSLSEVFQILNESMEGLDDSARLKAVNTIFGARAAPSALILAGQGAEGFEAYTEAIERTEAADVAAKRLDNLAGAVTRLKAAIEATFIQAGTPFQEFLTDVVQLITKLVIAFSNLPEGVQSFILASIAVVGLLALLSGGFLLTIGNIIRAIRVFGELGLAFRTIGTILGSLTKAFGLFSAALLTNPVFLIIAALVALGVAFYIAWQRSEEFREFIKGLGDDIVAAWEGVVSFFEGLPDRIGGALDGMQTRIETFFSGISITEPLESLERSWAAFWESGFGGDGITTSGDKLIGVLERAGVAVSELYDSAKGGAGSALTTVFDTLGGLGSGAVGGIESAFNSVVQFGQELPGILASAGQTAVDGFIGFMEKLPGRLGYALGFAIGRTARWGIILTLKMYEIGEKVLGAVIEWGGKIVYGFAKWITETVVQVGIWGYQLAQKAKMAALGFLFIIGEFFYQLPALIGDAVGIALRWIISQIPIWIQSGWDIGSGFLNGVVGFVQQLPGLILQFLTEAYNFVTGTIPNFIVAAIDIGQGIYDGIIDTITDIPGAILGIINDGIAMFKGAVNRAKDAARDFGAGIWNGFKDGMGISSPSYIERALFAIEDQVVNTSEALNAGVRGINDQATRLPTVATTDHRQLALATGSVYDRASSRAAGNEAGSVWNQNAPLIGEATIRTDEDIVSLARALEREQNRKKRAVGDRN